MIRRTLTALVALTLLVAPTAAFAARQAGPRPFRSETVSISHGKWAPWYDDGGLTVTVTAAEFLAKCAVPEATNGFDAYVWEVPRDYRRITAAIHTKGKGTGLDGAPYHDIDIYIYDADCTQIAAFASSNTDESGFLPAGSAFILLNNYNTVATGPAVVSFGLRPMKATTHP